jgi:hypothetical protein
MNDTINELEMLQMIEQCFKNEELKRTYENYNEVWEKDKRFPYFNYFGINFNSKGIVSVKFYFHVFREITETEAALFLPTTEDFAKYYSYYHESLIQTTEHSGCAFELKFFPNLSDPIKGFHFRMNPTTKVYDLLGYPKLIPYSLDETHLSPGINYEYHPEHKLRKTYYYLNQQKHKIYFAEKFNLPFIKSAKLIEYSESESFSKINAWFGNDPTYYNQSNTLENKNKELIDYLCSRYNLEAKFFGFYLNSETKAVYLTRLKYNFSNNENFANEVYNDTISRFIYED